MISIVISSILSILIYNSFNRLLSANINRRTISFLAGLILAATIGCLYEASNAYAFKKLADSIDVSTQKNYRELTDKEIATGPIDQREMLSPKWASTAFINAGVLLHVTNISNQSSLYRPTYSDIRAREALVSVLSEANSTRLKISERSNTEFHKSIVWLVNLIVATISGSAIVIRRQRSL